MTTQRVGFPPQIKYIVWNEGCERFSYYGMRSILVIFMIQHLMMEESVAKGTYHLFNTAAWFLPLLGGFIADRYWGKYRTIINFSILYCLGHWVLALFEGSGGLYSGMALIALGVGGIKPCVTAHVGDQFNPINKHLLPKIFDLWYWMINVGSTLSMVFIPYVLPHYGPAWAFGIPGILMVVATFIFWLGKKHYVFIPPTGKQASMRFFGVLWYAATHLEQRKPGRHFLDVALAKFDRERVEGAKAAVAVFKVFFWVSGFWALFEQQGSSWILQAEKMNRAFGGATLESSQIQSINPFEILILIPVFSLWIYPLIERLGIRLTPLRKMGTGMVVTVLSFISMGLIQISVDANPGQISVWWQLVPYTLMTVAEILISITGLEFAYTQTPRAMKSTVMGLWFLTIAAGNFLTAFVSYLNRFQGAMEFFFYAGMMGGVAILFILGTLQYRERSYIEEG